MVSWTSEADAKLLMAIIKTAKPKIDHDAVAQYMGTDFTAYAIQHRLRKLQAKASGNGSEQNSPAKPQKNNKEPKTPSPRKGGTQNSTPKKRQLDDQVADTEVTPPKKVKKEARECDENAGEYA